MISLNPFLPLLGKLSYTESVEILKTIFPKIHGRAVSTLDNDITTLAASAQKLFSDIRIQDTTQIVSAMKGKNKNLVMAGGASLNLDSNTEILNSFPKMNHFIAPCCDDTGQSLGAICILLSVILKKRPSVKLPYLGTGNNDFAFDIDSINSVVSILLDDGVVILHNGKSEVGPRALGNRSLIVRPDKIEVKKKLSERIKQREDYRPLAPVVLQEKVHDYFIGVEISPFMLYKYDVKEIIKKKLKVQSIAMEAQEFRQLTGILMSSYTN